MKLKDLFLALAKHIPPLIKVDTKIENNFYIGKTVVPMKDGKMIIDNREIKVAEVEDDKLKAIDIDGTEIELYGKSKTDNIKRLDIQGRVFTRSDIADSQLEYLKIDKGYEAIIKRLKPVLSTPTHMADLGALVSSSAIIKIEDNEQNVGQAKDLHTKLAIGYRRRGLMIYNLFRSTILQVEVLNFLNGLKKKYKNNYEEIKPIFLPYWDSILEEGYPTAYFVTGEDNREKVYSEIIKRFNKGIKCVRIYSRTNKRNKDTEQWCRKFASDYKCNCNKVREYKLGSTPAMKFRIITKCWKTEV